MIRKTLAVAVVAFGLLMSTASAHFVSASQAAEAARQWVLGFHPNAQYFEHSFMYTAGSHSWYIEKFTWVRDHGFGQDCGVQLVRVEHLTVAYQSGIRCQWSPVF